MLKQRDFRLVHALNGIHRRRHVFLTLYLLATAIILMWLLGLGGPVAVAAGPYVFSSHHPSPSMHVYWTARGWMQSPLASMTGWEGPTLECSFHIVQCVPGCAYGPWPLWLRLCINVMLLLPLAAVLGFSLHWFVRQLVQAASEPSMDPPTLSRDAAMAIPLGAPLCAGVHTFLVSLEWLLNNVIGPGWYGLIPDAHILHVMKLTEPGYIPALLPWPIGIVLAFVVLRLLARWRRGVLGALRGLVRIIGFSVVLVMLSGLSAVGSQNFMYFDPATMFLFFACLLPLYWSLGALIALTYRWPFLRQKVMGSYCVQCGYDMRGSFAVGHRECPECGQVNEITPVVGTQA